MYRGCASKSGMGVKSNKSYNPYKTLFNTESRWCRTYATLDTSTIICGREQLNNDAVTQSSAFWMYGTSLVFGLHDGNDAPGWCIDIGLTHATKASMTFNRDGSNVTKSTGTGQHATDAWEHWVFTFEDKGGSELVLKIYKNGSLNLEVSTSYSSDTMEIHDDCGRFCIGAQGEYVNPSTDVRTFCEDIGNADCNLADLAYWKGTILMGLC